MKKSAELSKCGTYRYTLKRCWGEGRRTVCWIMLNPSTADHTEDDPTIWRCIRFSQDWGYDRLVVVNLWPYRATSSRDPGFLKFVRWEHNGPDWWVRDQIHFRNLPIIEQHVYGSDLSVAAWGANAMKLDSGYVEHVAEELSWGDKPLDFMGLHCLGTTKDGSPRHPLYVKADAEPIPWNPA